MDASADEGVIAFMNAAFGLRLAAAFLTTAFFTAFFATAFFTAFFAAFLAVAMILLPEMGACTWNADRTEADPPVTGSPCFIDGKLYRNREGTEALRSAFFIGENGPVACLRPRASRRGSSPGAPTGR